MAIPNRLTLVSDERYMISYGIERDGTSSGPGKASFFNFSSSSRDQDCSWSRTFLVYTRPKFLSSKEYLPSRPTYSLATQSQSINID